MDTHIFETHTSNKTHKYGVLLVNLGTPESATPKAVKQFLTEFLSDPRVVDLPRWFWLPLLHCVILPKRSVAKAKSYQKIWFKNKHSELGTSADTLESNGSPLMCYSIAQQQQLQQQLQQPVALAMTYGNPSINNALDQLQKEQCTHITILPLFAQYSSSTTGAVYDGLFKAIKHRFYIPQLKFINSYHDHPSYINALIDSIYTHWGQNCSAQRLLCSFHGIPKRYAQLGDVYPTQCEETFNALQKELNLADDRMILCYQSRFGKEPWLTPYTDELVINLAKQGIKTLDIICPGFASDCLETLEEIAIDLNHLFVKHGGQQLNYIPCLNNQPAHIHLLTKLIKTA